MPHLYTPGPWGGLFAGTTRSSNGLPNTGPTTPPPDLPQLESPPQALIKMAPPTPKFFFIPDVYKMTKVLEDGRENG